MKPTYLLLIMALIFMACSDQYEQTVNESIQTYTLQTLAKDTKPFEFGKKYAIYEIPNDVYNYINRDSLDAFIFSNLPQMDSIAFYKINDFKKLHENEIHITRNTNDDDDDDDDDDPNIYRLGSYNNLFALYLRVQGRIISTNPVEYDVYLDFFIEQLSLKTEAFFVIEETNITNLIAYYDPCLPVPPDFTEPCEEGMKVIFNANGVIVQYSMISAVIPDYKYIRYRFDAMGDLPWGAYATIQQSK